MSHDFPVGPVTEIFDRADADVTLCDAREHRTWQEAILPQDVLARRDDGERTRGGDAEREHGLADDIFPQHRTKRGAAIAIAGKRRWPGALQLYVASDTIRVAQFAQEDRTPVAQLRNPAAELMPRISHRQWFGAVGNFVPAQRFDAVRRRKPNWVKSQFSRQWHVQLDEPGLRDRGRRELCVEPLRQSRIGIVEREGLVWARVIQ